jgi:hypothetical protein
MKRLLVALALLAPACFNVDERPCSFACGPGGACPDDYQCLADGYCHLHGDPAECGYSDMSMPDLPPMDLSTPDLAASDLSGTDGPPQEDGPPGVDATPSCFDGVQSGDETDVDCGGSCAAKCTSGLMCGVGADCASGFCGATSKRCVDTHCADQSSDDGETDVDCGGGTCGTCALTQHCGGLADGARDCASTFCSKTSKVCVASTCTDEAADNNETDVDCGGPAGTCATRCALGKTCATGADCASTFCSAVDKQCVANTCADEAVDNGETDVDCGGPIGTCATRCALTKTCATGADCASGICSATSKVCVATTCFDQIPDNGETDVDCGGPCGGCGLTKSCSSGADCTSTFCSALGKQCVATACFDQTIDSGETDVDCGGSICTARCGAGKMCTVDGDCANGTCVGNVSCN